MAVFNVIEFQNQTRKARINSFKNIALNAAKVKFRNYKSQLLKEFDNSEITKEIQAGPTAENISNTLKGRGNLFSFIGFDKSEKPIETVKRYLTVLISMDELDPKIEETGESVTFSFNVRVPSLSQIYDVTPLPFEPGKSWVKGIENGINGFTNYIYWKTRLPNPPSRSSAGLQAEFTLRNFEFSKRPYISHMLDNLIANLE